MTFDSRTLFEQSGDAMFVSELETARIVDANPAATRLLGYRRDELLEMVGRDLHPTDAGDVVRIHSGALNTGRDHRSRCARMQHKDGSIVYCDMVFTLFEEEGQGFYLVVARDISHLVQAERVREQRELRDRSLGRLVRYLGHDVNNPAAVLMANLDYLSNAVSRLPSHEVLDARHAVRDCQTSLQRILDSVQELQELRPDRPLGRTERVDLPQMCREALRLCQQNDVLLRVEELALLDTSRAELLEVLVDLVVQMGDVRSMRAYQVQGQHVVSVKGPAPDRSAVDDIFSATGRREVRLALLGGRAARLGAHLDIRQLEDGQRECRLSLPSVAATIEQFGRLLIVDDETTLLEALKRILSTHYEVHTAASGPAAWALIQRDDRWDGILCDMMMPGFGGAELHQRVRDLDPGLAGRMVFMTGATLRPADEDFLRKHDRHLRKPFKGKALLEYLKEHLAPAISQG